MGEEELAFNFLAVPVEGFIPPHRRFIPLKLRFTLKPLLLNPFQSQFWVNHQPLFNSS